jgi:hypothetical protein
VRTQPSTTEADTPALFYLDGIICGLREGILPSPIFLIVQPHGAPKAHSAEFLDVTFATPGREAVLVFRVAPPNAPRGTPCR